MTGQKLISKADFSRQYSISQSMVTKLSKGSLLKAMVGKRIDIAHPTVELYLAKKLKRKQTAETKAAKSIDDLQAAAEAAPASQLTVLPTATAPKVRRGRPKAVKDVISDGFMQPPDDDELGQFAEMKLKTLLKRYGTLGQFKDLLSATKLIEEILAKRISNAKASGDLISREHVHAHVFGAIESILIRLIQDSPRTIAARVIIALESGDTPEDVEVIIRDLLSSQIRGMKKEVTKGLQSA